MKRWLMGMALVMTVGISAVQAQTQKILMVQENFYTFTQVAQHLRSNGYQVDLVNIGNTIITPSLLAPYNQLWYFGSNPGTQRIIQQAEVDAMLAFQRNGGALFLVGDHKARSGQYCSYPGDYNRNLNQITRNYGVACTGCINNLTTPYASWDLFAPEKSSHPIWNGVQQVYAHDSECEMTISDGKVNVIGRMRNSWPMLAVRNGCAPEGKIAFDSTYFRYMDGFFFSGDQRAYAVNIAGWLSTKTSCNAAPVAGAGPDQVLEMESCSGATAVLDGSRSSDPDGDSLTYHWSWPGGKAEGKVVRTVLPLGSHLVTLKVTDPAGLTSDDTTVIKVADTIAPVLQVTVDRSVLWPPNHKLVPVKIATNPADACLDTTKVELVAVTSSESANMVGDGNTNSDIVISGPGTVLLRAERAGKGQGRTYTLLYRATDGAGNKTNSSAIVKVPLNR